jgi:exoribonuclease-2
MSNSPRQDSLVLYKNRPARVAQLGDKLEIRLEDGKSLKVRPKDVSLLHPGPLRSLAELKPQTGEIATAWELLAGETTTLPELADLIYEVYTPATAWATWELIDEGLYFRGTPEADEVREVEAVEAERTARAAKAAEKEAWAAFIERVGRREMRPEDERYLTEVEQLALGLRDKSRVLRELGRSESPESAHTFLLELGYWDQSHNPYPARMALALTSPDLTLPALPDDATRRNLTHLPTFAIDDAGSTDPDDAISLDGNRLWVHVADVAALIPPDSPADVEARARGANLYLPEQTIGMLPGPATDILALGLHDVSPALSFGVEVKSAGEIGEVEITPSWVRVERLSYEEADTRLAEAPFQRLYDIAAAYQARRQANGAIELDLPEVKLRVDEHGQVVIRPILNLRSRDIVRESMLMAGEAVARFALTHELPFPFTSQDQPNEPEEPLPEGLAGMFARRFTMRPGQVRSVPAGHAGLGLDLYSRVTSPLRRYLDLVAHQQLRAHMAGKPLLNEATLIERVGVAEAVSGDVRRAERLANRHWTLVYFQQHPGWSGEGIVVEKRGRNDTVLIPELDFEVRMALKGDVSLNSVVPLKLRTVNLPELEARFGVSSP